MLLILLDLQCTAKTICSNFNKTLGSLAGQNLKAIGKNVELQWRALLKQRCFKLIETELEPHESLLTILDEHQRNISNPSYWKKKAIVDIY